jgi:hypothetical protein
MKQASDIYEDLLANVKPDEGLLAKMKENWKKQLLNAKSDKDANADALETYTIYGAENPQTCSLKPAEIDKLTAEELVNIVKDCLSINTQLYTMDLLQKTKLSLS